MVFQGSLRPPTRKKTHTTKTHSGVRLCIWNIFYWIVKIQVSAPFSFSFILQKPECIVRAFTSWDVSRENNLRDLSGEIFCKSCFWWVWDVGVERGRRICGWFTAFVRPVFRWDNGPKVRQPTLWRDYVRWPVRECFLIFPLGNEQHSKRKQRLNLFCSWGHEIQNLMKEQVRPPVFSRGGKENRGESTSNYSTTSLAPLPATFERFLNPPFCLVCFWTVNSVGPN